MQKLYKRIILKIKWLLRTRYANIDIQEKREIIEFYRKLFNPSIFVETGTFFGDTVDFFKTKFKHIYSIELSEELAQNAAIRFEQDQNVQIIHGNSADQLPAIVQSLPDRALFWLDGHYSSEFYLNGKLIKTAKGETDTPIEKELDILLGMRNRQIILIDDARLFDGKGTYPSIKFIRERVKSSRLDYKVIVHKDIIQIIPT